MDTAEIIVTTGGMLLIAAILWFFFGPRKAMVAVSGTAGVQEVEILVQGDTRPAESRYAPDGRCA